MKNPAKQPFSFLIKWEVGQNKYKGVSAVLETCNREEYGIARRQVYMLLPPYNITAACVMRPPTVKVGVP